MGDSDEEIGLIMQPPRGPRRPRCPESQRRYQILEDLKKKDPELFKSQLDKTKADRIKPKPSIKDLELRKLRRAAIYERTGPVTLTYVPQTIRDTSELDCDTIADAIFYKKVANADPSELLFKVFNPDTNLPDEVYKERVFDRYKEKHCDSTLTVTASDDVQGTSLLKRRREELGKSNETVVTSYVDAFMKLVDPRPLETKLKVVNPKTGKHDEVLKACLFKPFRKDLCDSSVTASDDVQGKPVLKRHREDLGVSSENETVVAAPGN